MMADDDSIRQTDLEDFPTVRSFGSGTRVFGRYVLESLAGRSGLGVVWRAHDAERDEPVALKFLPDVVARDDRAVAELKDETVQVSGLVHPNIARVYQFEREGAAAAIAMEFVNGTTLAHRRLQQPGKIYPVETLAPLVAQLCAALDYAHQQANIIHRDLRPANILVTQEGVVKVTDFGIARSLGDLNARLTGRAGNTGSALLCMSPQQLQGDDPSTSDDIYALGAILYELLTGRPPFYTGDVAWQIREMAPKPVNSRLAAFRLQPVPAAWDETVLACLAKEPERRPQSAGAVAARLNLAGPPAQAMPPAAVEPRAPSDAQPREFTVIVDPADAGARVWLGPASNAEVKDGRVVLENLPDGEQELIVQAEGYQLFTTRVNVANGRGSAQARLIPVKGAIAIAARPGTVVTAIDSRGRGLGLGTVPEGGVLTNDTLLTVGAYRLKFAHADFAPVELADVELVVGRTVRVAPVQAPLPGELRVFSLPTGAEVRVNGAVAGSTPATIRSQPSGPALRIEVFQPGYRRVEQTVTLKPREARNVNFGLLTPESGGIALRARNAGFGWAAAAVTVDGKPVQPGIEVAVPSGTSASQAPFLIEGLEVGSRTVEVSHPDYEPWKLTVEVRDHGNAEVNVALAPKPGTVACETTPAGARVVINGMDQHDATFIDSQTEAECVTPLRGMLSPGTYTLRFELKDYKSVTRSVTVVANQSADVAATLEKISRPEEGRAWTVPNLDLGMVFIQPGTFTMGSATGGADEKPQTHVTLGKGFWIGKTEVTQTQWEAVMGTTAAQQRDKVNREWALRGEGRDFPIYYVNWDEAMDFCRKLTEREHAADRLPDGLAYTLPTEAQWEYACRAGTTENHAGTLEAMAWYGSDKGGQTHPVAQKQANAWGLFDMHGNVREWCLDWYQDHLPGGNVVDPVGPASGPTRVTRGGSWVSPARDCRSAARFGSPPALRQGSLGFRLALTPGRPEKSKQSGPGKKAEVRSSPEIRTGNQAIAEPAVSPPAGGGTSGLGSAAVDDLPTVRGVPEIRGAELQPAAPGRRDGEPGTAAPKTRLYKVPDSEPIGCGAFLAGVAVLVLAAAGWWFFGSNHPAPQKTGPEGAEATTKAVQAQESAGEQPRMQMVERGSDISHEVSAVPATPSQEPKAVNPSAQAPAPSVGARPQGTQPGATPGTLEKPRGAEEGHPWTVPDLNLEMVYVHPGGFTLGSPDSEKGRYKNESPQTQVTLTKGYWLGKTAVTQGQWEALMTDNPSNVKGADRPVDRVTWDDATEFCRKLTERERAAGRLTDGYVYALPTEAQWEYACRAGTTGPYAGAGNLDNLGWYSLNSGGTTHPVGQKQPNAWGLYDMHGNVGQWCRDWYGDYPGGSATDPAGPATGSFRVDRGGSCSLPARFCRSAFRRRIEPGSRENNLGFRLALAPAR